MSQPEETFNLDRHQNIENSIDALGKKWNIARAGRETTLLIAVPEPYRADFVCPQEMQGKWTSKDVLQERISLYLKRSWDQADLMKVKATRKVEAKKEEVKKTPEESLSTLPAEIKEALGEVIAVEDATKTGG